MIVDFPEGTKFLQKPLFLIHKFVSTSLISCHTPSVPSLIFLVIESQKASFDFEHL